MIIAIFPIVIAAISPPSNQYAEKQGIDAYLSFQTLLPLVIGIALGWFGHVLSAYRERHNRIRAGRDKFQEVVADMRAKLDKMQGDPGAFISESTPILRQAIYRAEAFAKDWTGLHRAWLDYEAKDYKDSKLTEFATKVDAATAKHQGGKTPIETLSEYLDRFKKCVG